MVYRVHAMTARRLSHALLCAIFSLFAVGCPLGDPVRTTSQAIRLRVVDSASGTPVSYADVFLKDDFDSAFRLSQEETSDWPFKEKETVQPPKEQRWYYRRVWEREPWFRCATDKDGQAEIEVEYTELDRTQGSKPPAQRDYVTGRPYLVRVKKDQAPEEESSVLMKPGESVKGKSFTVTVIEIHAPRYVESKF
jgi:hypothetical protein